MVNPAPRRKLPTMQRSCAVVQKLILRDLRRNGMSLGDAARSAGLAKSSLDAVLNREYKRRPSRKTLDRLARAPWVGGFTRRGLTEILSCVA